MTDLIQNLHKVTAILGPKKHIFLLSHMRSYTSLFGHIMGSNPEICGYYEMHIGYHSWRSLIRQKILYFRQEEPKPKFSYMFDKILHDEHAISPAILHSERTRIIFCLRHPKEVIPSILKLYQSVDPAHEFNSDVYATEYYVRRLASLIVIADSLQQDFFYLDAEALKSDTQECLGLMSDWLHLKTQLSSNYKIQRNTSRKRFGDSSESLGVGRILNEASPYTCFEHNDELLSRALHAYHSARTHLIHASAKHCTDSHASLS